MPNCYTGKAAFPSISGFLGFNTQGCLASASCNSTTNGTILGATYLMTRTCCHRQLQTRGQRAGSVQLSLTAAASAPWWPPCGQLAVLDAAVKSQIGSPVFKQPLLFMPQLIPFCTKLNWLVYLHLYGICSLHSTLYTLTRVSFSSSDGQQHCENLLIPGNSLC
ncbi:hypothetical protein AAFF_G00104110 [Aldrovandia affinis]|uniref:Uncharacterized protein n=1 Tax=Aldrovandia affinis TaxID=143900 RepID=A0AAD7R3C1_9TELE|nr:hypothetical protein AAFF_G00104110 [Aldrovandia affinis]